MSSTYASETIVQATGVAKSYGTGAQASCALDRIDLRIGRGEFVSLMGPSGSGKSTLLNLIAGLDSPDQGTLTFEGRDLGSLRDHELADLRLRRIGFVFQAFNLIPALTVGQNVSWPLAYSGYRRAEIRERTAQALARVEVTGRDHSYPAELSGGEQQRVAVARAIVTSPVLLLADEPTGNLDSHKGRLILDLLRRLNESDGVTVLMVTHNVLAASYGDRTLELRDGRIIHDVATPPDEPQSTLATAEP
jgi:putative ABC transport system ATP-binding protein